MAIDNLTKIAEDKQQLAKLKSLIERKHALQLAQEVHAEESKQINEEAKTLGVKAGELTAIVKYAYMCDFMDYSFSLIEFTQDHIIGGYNE